MLSLIIPVYKNEANLERLLKELSKVTGQVADTVEVVFVVDGSPDRCYISLQEKLPHVPFQTQLLSLSRNFGSFAAIAAGLGAARGDHFAVLAADLQEPPELILQFADALQGDEADIVFGIRSSRSDPWFTELSSSLFWWVYRKFILPEMPPGGVDIFACTREVRDKLLSFKELNTNLIALLFWLGYRRKYVLYDRQARLEGKSAWTFKKKLRYSVNSIFSFTDLPLQFLLGVGALGSTVATVLGAIVLICRGLGLVPVPGYTAIIITIMFFGGLTTFGLGIIGQYLWISLQNTRNRPNFIVWRQHNFTGGRDERTAVSNVKAMSERKGGGL